MSIATEISRLQTAKSDLKTSIENKGVTVPSATTLDGYAALVDQISGGGIGEVTFSGSLSITNNTNIWQYLGIDSVYTGDSFCIIVLQNVYVRNTAMAYMSEYCVFFNENCIDQPPQSPVADANEDYKYYLVPLVTPSNSTAYIRTVKNDSLSATITKIIKVQRA